MKKLRLELDKFQILSHELSDAIYLYFQGGHASTIINLAHSCRMLSRDITSYYKKQFSPRWDDFELYTDGVDEVSGTAFFNLKKINGKQGEYVASGNSVKHADKDTESLVMLSDQAAYEYLSVVILDFVRLKEALQACKQVSMHSEHSKAKKQSAFLRGGIRCLKPLTDMFLSSSLLRTPYSTEPKIDYLCNVFREWERQIDQIYNHRVGKQQFYEPSPWHHFSLIDDFRISGAAHDGLSSVTDKEIFAILKARFGLLSEADVWKIRQESPFHMRETMRQHSRHRVASIIQRDFSKSDWHGAGYYLKLEDDVVPDETGLVVNFEGYEALMR